jgi:hypothetical protein
MNLIKPRASHWYKQEDGLLLPKYEVPNKSKPGMMRKTTLADAKKGNYWPSITNVLGVLNKPALTNWLITQGILAALTLPRKPDESEDQFADRVVTDMDTEGATAREFGTRIHDALDARLQGMSIPADEDPVVTPLPERGLGMDAGERDQRHRHRILRGQSQGVRGRAAGR